jgi:hypothetical protein
MSPAAPEKQSKWAWYGSIVVSQDDFPTFLNDLCVSSTICIGISKKKKGESRRRKMMNGFNWYQA